MSRPLQPYQRQVGLTVPAVPVAPGAAFGQAAVALAGQFNEADEQRQVVDVSKRIAEAKLAWSQRLVDAPGEVEPGAPGYAAKYLDEMRADLKERGKGFSGKARGYWEARSEDMIGTLGLHAGEFEAKQRAAKVTADVIEAADMQAKAVRSDPRLLDGAIKEVRGMIAGMTGVDPARRREAEKDAVGRLGVSAVEATFDRSPHQAYADLQSGKYDAIIDGDRKIALMNKAEREIKRLRSEGMALAAEGRRALGEEARATEQRVLMGKADPSEFAALSARMAKAGLPSQAILYGELAKRADVIEVFAKASTAEQTQILAAASPFVAGARQQEQTERQAAIAAKQEETRLFNAYVAEANRLHTEASAALDAGARPDQMRDQLTTAYALASRAGNREAMEKIERTAGQYNAIDHIRGMSTTDMDAIVKREGGRLAGEGGQAAEFVIRKKMEEERDRAVAGYKADAFKEGASRRGYEVPPVGFDPESLKVRARQADEILRMEPTLAKDMAPFTKDELAQIAASIASAPENQRMARLDALKDGLGPTWYAKTLKAMGDDGARALAWGGGMVDVDRPAAAIIIAGAEVRKTNPKIVPGGQDVPIAIQDYVGTVFRDSPAALESAREAVLSAYAKHAFDAGKTDGKFDSAIMDKALKTAIGPVVTFNGQSIIPPDRKMTGAGFRDAMDRLSDADLPPGLKTTEGDVIDAARIRRYGLLSNAGDGLYYVRLPDRGGVVRQIPDPTKPGKELIIDVSSLVGRPRSSGSALEGELGTFSNADGSHSTEVSITVTDPRLNGGKPTNIPTLVKGQSPESVKRILAGEIGGREMDVAVIRAIERQKSGASLPSYASIEEAEKAAAARSRAKGVASARPGAAQTDRLRRAPASPRDVAPGAPTIR